MRRLITGKAATINLDSDRSELGCRVDAVAGPVACLSLAPPVPGDAVERMTPGALGYLVFDDAGAPVGLRGVATPGSGADRVDFVVIDGVQIRERRIASRLRMVLRARVSGTADGAEASSVETVTSNVSLGGALLTRRPGMPDDGLRLELYPRLDAEPLAIGASVVRATATHVAVHFDEIADADRIRLAGAIAERQRLMGV